MIDKKIFQDLAPRFTIGVLARKTGCNIETIRYYEKAGIIPHPARSDGGHRLYGTGCGSACNRDPVSGVIGV